jgi:hypothetical protein
LDVGVFSPLKTLMASEIEPLVSTEVHRILKAEWLSAYVEAHKKAFLFKTSSLASAVQEFDPSIPQKSSIELRPSVKIPLNFTA